MRLVCPNCDAEYEVDDGAIPLTGRDVQCSNCGHAWFQAHPEIVAEQADEEALFGAPQDHFAAEPEALLAEEEAFGDLSAAAVAEHEPEAELENAAVMEADAEAPPTPAVETAAPVMAEPAATRNIDDSVLAVLREEAAREAAARRAETPVLETQTEMPLDSEQGRRASRLQPVSDVARTTEPPPLRSRGDRLPAIDEINSTLRATSSRADDEDDQALTSTMPGDPPRSGFRQGFLLLVLLGVIILALYVFAPLIGEKVPALAGVAAGYVMAVDAARSFLDDEIRRLIGMLRGMAGSAEG